ncbi:unnamed protein product [Ambrosiozyma monospora]|uniref:Unnamed protein product n=1 Tax=Ambrosiozyma monospora TaxID=43982 RepID=A0ACB5U6Q7_AMBMO|nr:unnamed protein product [Ambrosiozyma monospora]
MLFSFFWFLLSVISKIVASHSVVQFVSNLGPWLKLYFNSFVQFLDFNFTINISIMNILMALTNCYSFINSLPTAPVLLALGILLLWWWIRRPSIKSAARSSRKEDPGVINNIYLNQPVSNPAAAASEPRLNTASSSSASSRPHKSLFAKFWSLFSAVPKRDEKLLPATYRFPT